MTLDAFERYKHNTFLSPVSIETLEKLGRRCGITPETLILDTECGKGAAALVLAHLFGCTVTATETRPEFAEEARRRALFKDLSHAVDIITHSGSELPFDDAYFDLALRLGPAHPADTEDMLPELIRVVRPGGWILFSSIVWRPDCEEISSERIVKWLDSFAPLEVSDTEELWGRFEEAGLEIIAVEHETDAAWENFFAPQALSILENRRDQTSLPEAQSILDQWQKDLELYHTGGGKETLGYACFLLRRP